MLSLFTISMSGWVEGSNPFTPTSRLTLTLSLTLSLSLSLSLTLTSCLDMPKFGGPGTKRQSCQRRRCHDMTPPRPAAGQRAAPPPPPPRPPPPPPAQSQPQSLPQSPPHLAASPPHLAASPPHLAVSPPHLAPMSIEDAAFLAAGLGYLPATYRLLTDYLPTT